jgi:hypothetical protein
LRYLARFGFLRTQVAVIHPPSVQDSNRRNKPGEGEELTFTGAIIDQALHNAAGAGWGHRNQSQRTS